MQEHKLNLPEGLVSFLLRPGARTVFEIGACQGEDTILYAQAFPRARIYAFEPLPENFAVLRQSLANCDRAQAWQLALGDTRGEAVFHVSSGVPASGLSAQDSAVSRSSSLLAPSAERPESLDWLEFRHSIRVRTDTLDNFCREHGIERIDFIHMDVQGAELKLLNGAKRMLPRIRAIWMEVAFEKTYEGQPLEPETTRWMAERGFRKIHQVSYGPEGDALYYNMHLPLAWPRFIALRLLQKVGLVKR
jgi:FkbM family methyltransferase